MLVLTRKSNQSIMIGDEIEISVLSVMGDKVRIGIQAPRSIPVYRREVYVAIQREREEGLLGDETPVARGRARSASCRRASGAEPARPIPFFMAPVPGAIRESGYSARNITTETMTAVASSVSESTKKRDLPWLDHALGAALGGAALGAAAQQLAAIAVERRLLDERAFELVEALSHLHSRPSVALAAPERSG